MAADGCLLLLFMTNEICLLALRVSRRCDYPTPRRRRCLRPIQPGSTEALEAASNNQSFSARALQPDSLCSLASCFLQFDETGPRMRRTQSSEPERGRMQQTRTSAGFRRGCLGKIFQMFTLAALCVVHEGAAYTKAAALNCLASACISFSCFQATLDPIYLLSFFLARDRVHNALAKLRCSAPLPFTSERAS